MYNLIHLGYSGLLTVYILALFHVAEYCTRPCFTGIDRTPYNSYLCKKIGIYCKGVGIS